VRTKENVSGSAARRTNLVMLVMFVMLLTPFVLFMLASYCRLPRDQSEISPSAATLGKCVLAVLPLLRQVDPGIWMGTGLIRRLPPAMPASMQALARG
jgi:hypothetical protein